MRNPDGYFESESQNLNLGFDVVKSKQIEHTTKTSTIFKEAHGKLILLSIGIDTYDNYSGFQPLKTCSNDAIGVRDTLLDVHQLNGDSNRLFVLCSKTTPHPSKGEIIKEIQKISNLANDNDRLMLFYSGHGHRIKEDFYLVPQDAYDSQNPEALINFDRVLDIVRKSDAKQKIIILDACLSGPIFEEKKLLPAIYSKKFLTDYLKDTKGTVVLSSSTGEQASTTKSPDPKLSLFTHFLIQALRGDPNALDDQFLTVDSLYGYISSEVKRCAKSYHAKQFPSIDIKSNGVIILGDFAQALLSPESLDLEIYPVSTLKFVQNESLNVNKVLTYIKRWNYTQDYLENKVNEQLGNYLEEDFGRKASSLINNIRFSPDKVGVEGNYILFPCGEYYAEYIAKDKKHGKIVYTLSLKKDWFEQLKNIANIARALDLEPNEMRVELNKKIAPSEMIPGLKAKQWEITSALNHKVQARIYKYEIIVQESVITFKGFAPFELFGKEIDRKASQIAANVLELLFLTK